MACDVWLTEVSARLALPGYVEVRTDATMATGRAWAGGAPPWVGERHADETGAAYEALLNEQRRMRSCGEMTGITPCPDRRSRQHRGRDGVLAAVARAEPRAPTAELAHRIRGLLSVDHVAIPTSWDVDHASQGRRGIWCPPLRPRPG
jgi:hypothetical protein